MTTSRLRVLSLLPLLAATACVTHQVEPEGPRGPDLQNYTAQQLKESAAELLERRAVDEPERIELLRKLDDFCSQRAEVLRDPGVTGVAVYHSAGGGFLYKGSGGDGLASFCGGDQFVPFEVSGYEVGAVIGGGSHTGIALLVGLRDQRRFVGHYRSTGAEATMAESEVGTAAAEYIGDEAHFLRYFATGVGMEAQASVGRFTVTKNQP